MKHVNWILFTAILCGMFFAHPGWATQDSQIAGLQEIVVSAPRSDRTVVETPSSVTVITADDIEEMGATSIVEIVESIPGVVKDSDSRERLTFRGNRSSQSAGVLVLIDGVPANSGISGYVEFDAISVTDIERIEVIRSSAAVAFGPDASRGAVNIITKKGKEGSFAGKASVSYGSWDSLKVSASATGREGKWDYAFAGSSFNTDGYEDDSKEQGSARVSVGHNFSENTRLGFNLSWQNAEYDTIYGKSLWQAGNYRRERIFPTSETDDTLVHNRENEDENTAVSLQFNTKNETSFFNSLVSYDTTDHVYRYLPKRLNASYSTTSSYYDYQEDSEQDRILARAGGGYHFQFSKIRYTPTLGVDYEDISFDQTKSYPWSPTPISSSQQSAANKGTLDTERERYGIFLNNELDFGEKWELNFSGRFDRVEYDVESQQPNEVSNTHSDWSWDITPAFHPTKDATLYASLSKSYWYPVLIYYKYAMEYGDDENPPEDLAPEEYQTVELGYKQYVSPMLSLASTVYYTKVENKFLSLYDNSTWKGYQNVGESEHKGVELEASGRLNTMVGYRLQGAYQKAEWEDGTFRAYVWGATPADDTRQNVDISGQDVPHVPKLTGTFGLDFYFLERWKFSADLNYTGKQYVDVLNRYEIGSFVTTDLKLTYTADKYKVWILCNNIFDKEKDNIFNETGERNSDGTGDSLYYPLNGRYVEAGVSFAF